ncbi:MAG: teichuronic acid exporter [Salibacteraceae bacterium]
MSKRFKNKLLNSAFGKNVSTLFAGSVVSQIIPFASSTIIARLFSVSEQGIYAQVNSVMQIFSTLSDGKLGQAVVLPKEEKRANSVVVLALLFTLFFTLLTGIILFFAQQQISNYFNNPSLIHFLWVTPVFVFLVGVQRSLSYWLIRKDAFKWISILKISQSILTSFFMLFFGFIQLSGGWLLGYLAGWAGFSALTVWIALKNHLSLIYFSKPEIKSVAKEYKSFPVFYGIPSLLVEVSKQATIVLASLLFTLEQTGYYNFSRSIILIPISMFGVSLGQVLFKKIAASNQKKESIQSQVTKMSIGLLAASGLIIIVVHQFGAEIFQIIFSEKWRYSGEISQILVFSFALQLLVIPLNNILPAINQHKLASIYPVIYFLSMSSLFFRDYASFNEFLQILTYTEVTVYSIFAVIIIVAIYKYEKSI